MSAVCDLCFHHCRLDEGQTGACRARANRGGQHIAGSHGASRAHGTNGANGPGGTGGV